MITVKASQVQTVIFDAEKWTPEKAREWLDEHNLRHDKIDETENTLRFRQFHPERCQGGFQTLTENLPDGVSLVVCDVPDAEKSVAKSFYCRIVKADEHGFVLAPALVPNEPDHQGDVIDAATIEAAAHEFMENSQRPGFMHRRMLGPDDVVLVESYVLRKAERIGQTDLPAGTWIVGLRIYNEQIREMVRSGKLTGVSIGGTGQAHEP